MGARTIIHLDLDAFFASVEQLDEQVLDVQPPEGGVSERLDVAEVFVSASAIHGVGA